MCVIVKHTTRRYGQMDIVTWLIMKILDHTTYVFMVVLRSCLYLPIRPLHQILVSKFSLFYLNILNHREKGCDHTHMTH